MHQNIHLEEISWKYFTKITILYFGNISFVRNALAASELFEISVVYDSKIGIDFFAFF